MARKMVQQLDISIQFNKEPRIAVILVAFCRNKNEFPCFLLLPGVSKDGSRSAPKNIPVVNKPFTDCFVFNIGD